MADMEHDKVWAKYEKGEVCTKCSKGKHVTLTIKLYVLSAIKVST